MSRLLLLMLLVLTIAQAHALDLQQAQQLAMEHSAQLSQLEADVNIANSNMKKAFAPRLPSVYLSGRHLLANKPQEMAVNFGGQNTQFPLAQPYSTYVLGISQVLYDGSATSNHYQAAVLQHEASNANFDYAQFQLKEQVRTQFYKALGATELVSVSRQNVQVLQAHLRDVRNQVTLGAATRLEELKVELQLQEAQNSLESAQDDVYLAQAKLAQLMGVEKIDSPLQGSLPVLSSEAFQKLDFTPGERKDQQALDLLREGAQHVVAASRSVLFPTVSLYGQDELYSYSSKNPLPNGDFGNAYSVGVNVRWDLYDGGSHSAEHRIAIERLQQQQDKVRQAKQAMTVDIDFWKRKLKHDVAHYETGLLAQQKSEEAVRLAKDAVTLGTRTNTDVLDAEQDLNLSRLKIVKAQVAAVESLSRLELALGQPLHAFGLQ